MNNPLPKIERHYLKKLALLRATFGTLVTIRLSPGTAPTISSARAMAAIASDRLEYQEAAMLALHLLQNCIVYVNT